MEPYNYVITHYPSVKMPGADAKILYNGMMLADSQETAFRKMLEIVESGDNYDPEEVEFIAKPVLEEENYAKRKAAAMDLYNSYLKNSWSNVNTTVVWSEYSFQHLMPDKPSLPKVMMMIDVIALMRNDKKL
jgi:hypothetical protein